MCVCTCIHIHICDSLAPARDVINYSRVRCRERARSKRVNVLKGLHEARARALPCGDGVEIEMFLCSLLLPLYLAVMVVVAVVQTLNARHKHRVREPRK